MLVRDRNNAGAPMAASARPRPASRGRRHSLIRLE